MARGSYGIEQMRQEQEAVREAQPELTELQKLGALLYNQRRASDSQIALNTPEVSASTRAPIQPQSSAQTNELLLQPQSSKADRAANYRTRVIVGTGAATVAISALSLLSPTAAAATNETVNTAPKDNKTEAKSETPSTIQSSPIKSAPTGVSVQVGLPEVSTSADQSTSISSNPTESVKATAEVSVAPPTTTTTAEAVTVSSSPDIKTETSVNTVSVAMPESSPTIREDTITTPHENMPESSITVGSTPIETPITVTAPVVVAPPTPQPQPDTPGVEPSPSPSPEEPITIVAEPEIEVPTIDAETATPEQLAFQDISVAVQTNNIDAAVAILVENFHNKGVSEKNEQIANPALVTKIQELRTQYQVTLGAGGHSDTTYVNTSLMNFVVAEALATDANLNSETLATLFNIQYERPKGEYEAKLFNKFVAKADEILKTNDSELLKGLNDVNKAILEKVYPHLMVSILSEAAQTDEIQKIKDEEAAEAKRKADEKAEAERKAKEEAEAKKKAERDAADQDDRRGNYSKSIENQALNNLIDRAPDRVTKNAYIIMKFFMNSKSMRLTPEQAAGVLGNAHRESASTLNPKIKQFGGGPAEGIFQHEYGRLKAGKRFAEKQGKKFNQDIYVQLEFAEHELTVNGREWAFKPLKDSKTLEEATFAFLRWFETPRVVVDWIDRGGSKGPVDEETKVRADRGRPFLEAYYAEVKKLENRRQNSVETKDLAEYGPSFKDAVELAESFFQNRDKYLINMLRPKNRVQCTTLVNYFTRRYVSASGQEGNGVDVARIFANRNDNSYSLSSIDNIEPFTIFSLKGNHWDADPGHTGMIMSIDPDGSIIVVEANVQSRIRNAAGMLNFESFGNKRRENWRIGQVNVERWSSVDAWKRHWAKWGYTDPTFASPDNPEQIAKNFEKGSR